MKPVRYHLDARDELVESALYYETRQTGLADRFVDAVEQCEQAIQEFPRAGAPMGHGARRRRVQGFPYALVSKEYPDHILVVAVAHFSRKPKYWRERL